MEEIRGKLSHYCTLVNNNGNSVSITIRKTPFIVTQQPSMLPTRIKFASFTKICERSLARYNRRKEKKLTAWRSGCGFWQAVATPKCDFSDACQLMKLMLYDKYRKKKKRAWLNWHNDGGSFFYGGKKKRLTGQVPVTIFHYFITRGSRASLAYVCQT